MLITRIMGIMIMGIMTMRIIKIMRIMIVIDMTMRIIRIMHVRPFYILSRRRRSYLTTLCCYPHPDYI
jgi:hypothetical protein